MKRVRSGATRLRADSSERATNREGWRPLRRRQRGMRMRAFRQPGDLTTPRRTGLRLGVHYDTETFGRFSETIARFIGTARFLVFQTAVIIVWILHNTFAPKDLRFDEKPYILLTLILSLQAAYAAPLILLAQNRQADRDRTSSEHDRETAFRTQADTEFLARELASIRLALSDVITVDELERAMEVVADRAATQARTPEL